MHYLGSIEGAASRSVIAECDYLIGRDAPSTRTEQVAARVLRSYLASLEALQMPDASPPEGITTLDEGDHLLLGAAFAAKCDAICTYNVKDFPDSHIAVGTPLAIHRWIAAPQLEHCVQSVQLSDRGTPLFFGRLHHESSMGPILESGGIVTVVADEKGFIRLKGAGVKRCSAVKPLPRDTEFRLTIRYNGTDFEAALWTKGSSGWTKDIISTGAGTFSS